MFGIEFGPKKSASTYVYLLLEWSYDAWKIGKFEVLFYSETINYIKFRAQYCQKYASHQKKLPIKVVWNCVLSKKVCEHNCSSAAGVELWVSKDFKLFLMQCVFLAVFSLQNNTVNMPIFRGPGSTLAKDRHKRSETFLYKIQFRTTFI